MVDAEIVHLWLKILSIRILEITGVHYFFTEVFFAISPKRIHFYIRAYLKEQLNRIVDGYLAPSELVVRIL